MRAGINVDSMGALWRGNTYVLVVISSDTVVLNIKPSTGIYTKMSVACLINFFVFSHDPIVNSQK
jgi:hypothetical protein